MEGERKRTPKRDRASSEAIDVTRRRFLLGASALAGATAFAAYTEEQQEPRNVESREVTPVIQESQVKPREALAWDGDPRLSFLAYRPQPKQYEMYRLAGIRMGNLFTQYSGVEGLAGPIATVDFTERLSRMWQAKLERAKNHESDEYPQDLMSAAKELYSTYDVRAPHRSSLSIVRSKAARSLEEVRRSQKLDAVSSIPAFAKFSESHTRLFKYIESLIHEQTLIAYSVTELMPTSGADSASIGIEMYDFLLRSAGEDYIDRIPALGDTLVSFGPYQMTKHAIGEDFGPPRGASLMQRYLLKERHIPQSVSELRGSEHHKAAYLFALYNIASAVRMLSEKDAKQLLLQREWLSEADLSAFIAAAHHLPKPAIRAFAGYAKDVLTARRKGQPFKETLISYIERRSPKLAGPYAQKTAHNLAALQKVMRA